MSPLEEKAETGTERGPRKDSGLVEIFISPSGWRLGEVCSLCKNLLTTHL